MRNGALGVRGRQFATTFSGLFERRKRKSPVGQAMGEAFGLAAGGDVGEPDFVGEGGDDLVAAGGEFGGDAGGGLGEAGEDEQASVGQRLPPFGGDASGQGAGGAEDDGWRAAQQDAQALVLHRRMEAADDAVSGVAPTGGLVVGRQDDMAGAAGGAEEPGLGQGQQVEVAEGGQLGGCSVAQPLAQARRITGVSGSQYEGRHSSSVSVLRPRRYLMS